MYAEHCNYAIEINDDSMNDVIKNVNIFSLHNGKSLPKYPKREIGHKDQCYALAIQIINAYIKVRGY